MWDSRKKGPGMQDQHPPFQTLRNGPQGRKKILNRAALPV